jgi:hypothetical protein
MPLPNWQRRQTPPYSARLYSICRCRGRVLGSAMLHVWLIPALIILVLVLIGFYAVVKFTGGSGVRSEGRTLVDKPQDEDNG